MKTNAECMINTVKMESKKESAAVVEAWICLISYQEARAGDNKKDPREGLKYPSHSRPASRTFIMENAPRSPSIAIESVLNVREKEAREPLPVQNVTERDKSLE